VQVSPTAISRDGLERRLAIHVATATHSCSTLRGKKVSPHVLRHSSTSIL
jgi:site-specific recombinase XerD